MKYILNNTHEKIAKIGVQGSYTSSSGDTAAKYCDDARSMKPLHMKKSRKVGTKSVKLPHSEVIHIGDLKTMAE